MTTYLFVLSLVLFGVAIGAVGTSARLSRWDRFGLTALFAIVVTIGANVRL